MQIYENDYIVLTEDQSIVYIEVKKEGFSLKDFDTILQKYKRIKLASFAVLRTALSLGSDERVEIGSWLPPIEIEISKDCMKATMYINEDPSTIFHDEESMNRQIKEVAENAGIQFGIYSVSFETAMSEKSIIIAAGLPAKKGEDAKITYIKIPEKKPQILEDGRADYLDMNFIYEIEKDAWLGEKIPAQPGIPGKNVLGEEIPAIDGEDIPLNFEVASVYEQEEDGKTVIRAIDSGVIDYSNGTFSIQKHLLVKKDVGLETGNLTFDGSITIKGSILPGYSVVATGDIQIEGQEGVTGPKLIESTSGDVYIRGGIFGNGETVVRACGNIYVKHANDSTLKALKDIFIGSYAMGSDIKAQNIYVNEQQGKIIGGRAEATHSIHSAMSGNRLERKTELIIMIPDRIESAKLIKERREKIIKLEEEIADLDEKVFSLKPLLEHMNEAQRKTYDDIIEKINEKESEFKRLEVEVNEIAYQIKTMGDEIIHITKEAFPGTYIQIGKKSTTLNHTTCGKFKLENGEINV
ncbi:FapA family protein [Rummeliibacillus sp. NPDC094406]|uniref:DUF342 domain-containing protein n=1 Tax=Rummeliibacillus sp. NPDC094406 TaxID=3364511 RepID=UPI00381572DA